MLAVEPQYSTGTSARLLAEALKRDLNRGTDFGQLAREHSSSPDAKAGLIERAEKLSGALKKAGSNS